jgi:hypothetical protein
MYVLEWVTDHCFLFSFFRLYIEIRNKSVQKSDQQVSSVCRILIKDETLVYAFYCRAMKPSVFTDIGKTSLH